MDSTALDDLTVRLERLVLGVDDVVVLDPEEIEDIVVGELAGSALFAARFRENAARVLGIEAALA